MTRSPQAIPVRPAPTGQHYFRRACFQAAQRHALGDGYDPPEDRAVEAIIERANATVGTSGTAGWASELAATSLRQFLVDLAPYSGAARLIQLAVPATLQSGEYATTYPVRAARTVPGFVAEGEPIPVGARDFDLISIGPAKKMAHLLVWSRELGRRSDAERIFNTMLREDVIAGIDAAFFATTAATTAAPAGLLNGVSAITGSAATPASAAATADLAALAKAVASGGSGSVTFVMAPERLAALRILLPEVVAIADIVPSAALPTARVIAVDAPALFVSVDPAPDITSATSGTIHMSSVPLEIVSDTPVVADPVRELWQTASVSLRVIHELAFVKRRGGAVAWIDPVTW